MDDKYIVNQYVKEKKSLPEIAEELGTYANKIRRRLLKLGVEMRSKSESQKIALEHGRTQHPTEGKERDAATKLKLSEASAKAWENFSNKKKKEIKKKLAESWKNRPEEEILEMQKKAAAAISNAGRTGSKLENFLVENLPKRGYNVIAHKKGAIANTNLEPDLIIPDLNIVIEIDGPTHFLPIFGEEKLRKTQAADDEKNALFLQNGFCVLRVKHICKTLTGFKKRKALDEISEAIAKIKKNHKNTIIEIEV